MSKLIELHRPSFVMVFRVSALSAEHVTELLNEAARIAELSGGSPPIGVRGIERDQKESKCC
jgi:hypothetical protein